MGFYRTVVMLCCVAMLGASGCDLLKGTKRTAKTAKPAAVPSVPAAPAKAVEAPKPAASQTADVKAALPAGVLAKVGDWSITREEFSARLKSVKEMVKDFDEKDLGARGMLLNELVRQQLLVQEARKERLQDTKEVQAALKEFENTLLVQEIVTRLTKDVEVTEAAAREYYAANPEEFQKPVEKQIREIVVATQTEANEILVQVLQGGDFAQIAKDRSKAKSKENGGDLGYRMEAPFPAMAAAVATIKKGGVSSVFEGPEGFYVVKVEDSRGGESVSFDEVKTDLVKYLTLRAQQELLAEKVQQIQQQIKVQVNEELLKAGE